MGAIQKLRTHAEKSRTIKLTESVFVLSEEEDNERIQRLAKNIIRTYRNLQARRGRGKRGAIRNPGLDEGRAIFEEVSEDLEKRLGK